MFVLNDTAATEFYTHSLPDALRIGAVGRPMRQLPQQDSRKRACHGDRSNKGNAGPPRNMQMTGQMKRAGCVRIRQGHDWFAGKPPAFSLSVKEMAGEALRPLRSGSGTLLPQGQSAQQA